MRHNSLLTPNVIASMPKLKPFEGTCDDDGSAVHADEFMENFELRADMFELTYEQRAQQFLMYIPPDVAREVGKIFRMPLGRHESRRSRWEDMKERFLEHYGSIGSNTLTRRFEVQKMRMKKGSTISAHAAKFESVTVDAGFTEDERKDAFLATLPRDLRIDYLWNAASRAPDTWRRMLQILEAGWTMKYKAVADAKYPSSGGPNAFKKRKVSKGYAMMYRLLNGEDPDGEEFDSADSDAYYSNGDLSDPEEQERLIHHLSRHGWDCVKSESETAARPSGAAPKKPRAIAPRKGSVADLKEHIAHLETDMKLLKQAQAMEDVDEAANKQMVVYEPKQKNRNLRGVNQIAVAAVAPVSSGIVPQLPQYAVGPVQAGIVPQTPQYSYLYQQSAPTLMQPRLNPSYPDFQAQMPNAGAYLAMPSPMGLLPQVSPAPMGPPMPNPGERSAEYSSMNRSAVPPGQRNFVKREPKPVPQWPAGYTPLQESQWPALDHLYDNKPIKKFCGWCAGRSHVAAECQSLAYNEQQGEAYHRTKAKKEGRDWRADPNNPRSYTPRQPPFAAQGSFSPPALPASMSVVPQTPQVLAPPAAVGTANPPAAAPSLPVHPARQGTVDRANMNAQVAGVRSDRQQGAGGSAAVPSFRAYMIQGGMASKSLSTPSDEKRSSASCEAVSQELTPMMRIAQQLHSGLSLGSDENAQRMSSLFSSNFDDHFREARQVSLRGVLGDDPGVAGHVLCDTGANITCSALGPIQALGLEHLIQPLPEDFEATSATQHLMEFVGFIVLPFKLMGIGSSVESVRVDTVFVVTSITDPNFPFLLGTDQMDKFVRHIDIVNRKVVLKKDVASVSSVDFSSLVDAPSGSKWKAQALRHVDTRSARIGKMPAVSRFVEGRTQFQQRFMEPPDIVSDYYFRHSVGPGPLTPALLPRGHSIIDNLHKFRTVARGPIEKVEEQVTVFQKVGWPRTLETGHLIRLEKTVKFEEFFRLASHDVTVGKENYQTPLITSDSECKQFIEILINKDGPLRNGTPYAVEPFLSLRDGLVMPEEHDRVPPCPQDFNRLLISEPVEDSNEKKSEPMDLSSTSGLDPPIEKKFTRREKKLFARAQNTVRFAVDKAMILEPHSSAKLRVRIIPEDETHPVWAGYDLDEPYMFFNGDDTGELSHDVNKQLQISPTIIPGNRYQRPGIITLRVRNQRNFPLSLQVGSIVGRLAPFALFASKMALPTSAIRMVRSVEAVLKPDAKKDVTEETPDVTFPGADEEVTSSSAVSPDEVPYRYRARDVDILDLPPLPPEDDTYRFSRDEQAAEGSSKKTGQLSKEELLAQIRFGKKLTEEQREMLRELCRKYIHIFADQPLCPPAVPGVFHRIDTGDAPPFKFPPFPLSPVRRLEMHKRIEQLLNAGLIVRSNSPYASPCMFVYKPGKDPRFVIDYRKLNSQTTKNATPIHRPKDILQRLGRAKFYITSDLAAGYHQFLMHPDSEDKTAFCTPDGLFHWKRMPQGVCNGPPEFCRYVTSSFQDFLERGAFTYFDDLIGRSPTFHEFYLLVEAIFQRCADAGLHLKASKTVVGSDEAQFLGHLVKDGSISPLPEKVKSITEMSAPRNLKELRIFLGMVGYYRPHIPTFLEHARHLYELLKKNVPYEWNPQRQEAFEGLKKGLINHCKLYTPNDFEPFILHCDASNDGIGAVLSQLIDDIERPISFWSRRLTPTEKKYHATHRELLAIRDAVRHFRMHLHSPFTIYTDHQPLIALMRKERIEDARTQRWIWTLQEYNFTLKYKKGKDNQVADGLSRLSRPRMKNPMILLQTMNQDHHRRSIKSHVLSLNPRKRRSPYLLLLLLPLPRLLLFLLFLSKPILVLLT